MVSQQSWFGRLENHCLESIELFADEIGVGLQPAKLLGVAYAWLELDRIDESRRRQRGREST